MKKYRVACEALKVPGGVVELTDSQAKARADCLNDLGRNRYEVMKPVEFKKGEVVGVAESTHKYAPNDLELYEDKVKARSVKSADKPVKSTKVLDDSALKNSK